MARRREEHQSRNSSPDAHLEALLNRLDEHDQANPQAANRRRCARANFRRTGVPVRISHPGGSNSLKVVATRNLSSGGMAFLNTGFLHNGTHCAVVLKRRLGGEDVIQGRVMHCSHVGGTWHQIGVKFNAPIFPKLYLDPNDWTSVDDSESIDAGKLAGAVLHIDDQEMDRRLLKHHLRDTAITLVSCATSVEALALIKQQTFDVILCDLILAEEEGETVIQKLREAGFTGTIALVTAETTPSRLKLAQAAGAVGIISKPYQPARILSMLSGWLGGSAGEAPIHSNMDTESGMQPLLDEYVSNVRQLVIQLAVATEKKNVEAVRNLCVSLKGSGTNYGYPTLTEVACEAIKALDATASIEDATVQIQQLESICRRLVAEPPKSA